MQGAMRSQPTEPIGLDVGKLMPSFQLPDLTGQTVNLADFRSKWVFLVHWNPGCGFCHRIASELVELRSRLTKCNVELVLISHGDMELNRKLAEEHGLDYSILLLKESQSLEVFQNQGTPVAYLLDEEGKVEK